MRRPGAPALAEGLDLQCGPHCSRLRGDSEVDYNSHWHTCSGPGVKTPNKMLARGARRAGDPGYQMAARDFGSPETPDPGKIAQDRGKPRNPGTGPIGSGRLGIPEYSRVKFSRSRPADGKITAIFPVKSWPGAGRDSRFQGLGVDAFNIERS